jgi:hypothetical protein
MFKFLNRFIKYTVPPPAGYNSLAVTSDEDLKIKFSHESGFYDSPIELEISHPDPNAVINEQSFNSHWLS